MSLREKLPMVLVTVLYCFSVPIQAIVSPGEVVCRYTTSTSDAVNYYTCQSISYRYGIDVEDFFKLNPSVNSACDNVKINTEYCVRGCS